MAEYYWIIEYPYRNGIIILDSNGLESRVVLEINSVCIKPLICFTLNEVQLMQYGILYQT